MMVGREVILQVDKKEAEPGDSILEVKGLEARNDLDEICLSEVDLKVNAGEIVGVAGVQGNGQTELVEVLTGLRPLKNGILRIGGHDLSGATPREITDRGKICHVPEDRHSYGMVDNYSVADNLVLTFKSTSLRQISSRSFLASIPLTSRMLSPGSASFLST